MSQVVDQIAELTGFRDRDLLDLTLASSLRDLLRPLQVAIHRCVGDQSDLRWLTRARIGSQDTSARADPIWTDFKALPRLADHAARQQVVLQRQLVLQPGPPHLAVFPLLADREVVGVLEVQTDEAMSTADQRLVDSILRIFHNFQSLLDYSERDSLTGLLNRKTFDDSFYKLQVRPDPGQAPVQERRQSASRDLKHFIGVIDIDHFKSVNDTCGHLIGDEVLLLLSRLMRTTFRFHDRLYRFGGEEFVVLMNCASVADAGRALERFRSAVQAHAFPQVGRITVSVGFTEVQPGDTANSAFERADKAVYWAKTHGRNQVCSHADLVARGELADESKVGDVELF